MKTVFEHLKGVDREALATAFLNLNNPQLWEIEDKTRTVEDFMASGRRNFLAFLDGLLERTPNPNTGHVLCLRNKVPFVSDKEEVGMFRLDELYSGKMPEVYAFSFTPWNDLLGMGVVETGHAMKNMVDFLANLLDEMTFFGFNEADMEAEHGKLNETMEEVRTGTMQTRSLDEVFSELGIERQKPDEEEQELQRQILNAQMQYINYMRAKDVAEVRAVLGIHIEDPAKEEKEGTA